jgi:undecaprenyl-phosphate 4-deoxy-4-formamido-L-arabinose transferase
MLTGMVNIKVSIAIPIFNEEKNIPTLLSRLLPVMGALDVPYEVVFVDDGSRDRSLTLLKVAAERLPDHIRIIELSRNFGQHPALLAAFRYVTGQHIVTLDADLQNPPEEIPKILQKLREGYDVVGGVRADRQDSLFRKLASRIVNRVTVFITKMNLQDYGCMLRGYSREVIDQINKCEENSTFIPALGLLFARQPIEIPVEHAPRTRGESKYSLYRLIRLNFDLMTGFSIVPLQLFTLFGFMTASGGFLFGLYLFIRRYLLLRQSEAEGVFTLFALAFVVLGVLMAGLGIVGEYIGRIYQEVRGRPRYSIRQIYGNLNENKILDLQEARMELAARRRQ